MTPLPHTTVPMEPNRMVVMRTDWLPTESPFEELTELAEEHRATLEDLRKVNTEIRHLTTKYDKEDEQAVEAMRQAYLDGADDPKPPKRTPQMERDAKLLALKDKSHIVQESLQVLIEEIVQTIQEHEEEWCDVLRAGELEAQQKVLALREQLVIAEAEALRQPDMRDWVMRTAKNRAGWHIMWSWYMDKEKTTPTDLLTIANSGRNRQNSQPSAALSAETTATTDVRPDPDDVRAGGGVDRTTTAIPSYDDETLDYGSPDYLERLDAELRAHVAKQRTGTAAPGGM